MSDELDPKRPKFYLGQIVLMKPRPSQQPEATYAPVKITKVFEGSDGPAFVVKMLPDAEVEAIRQAEIKGLRKLEKRADELEAREARDAGRATATAGNEPPPDASADARPDADQDGGGTIPAAAPAGADGVADATAPPAPALGERPGAPELAEPAVEIPPGPAEPEHAATRDAGRREAPPQAPAPSRAKKGST